MGDCAMTTIKRRRDGAWLAPALEALSELEPGTIISVRWLTERVGNDGPPSRTSYLLAQMHAYHPEAVERVSRGVYRWTGVGVDQSGTRDASLDPGRCPTCSLQLPTGTDVCDLCG